MLSPPGCGPSIPRINQPLKISWLYNSALNAPDQNQSCSWVSLKQTRNVNLSPTSPRHRTAGSLRAERGGDSIEIILIAQTYWQGAAPLPSKKEKKKKSRLILCLFKLSFLIGGPVYGSYGELFLLPRHFPHTVQQNILAAVTTVFHSIGISRDFKINRIVDSKKNL